jgi:hypothetical protein
MTALSSYHPLPLIWTNMYLTVMKFNPGQQVIVLDTTHKPAGSAIVQLYEAEAHQYIVLFQYPGTTVPEAISIPEHRLLTAPVITASE